jgi:hypothetical protein
MRIDTSRVLVPKTSSNFDYLLEPRKHNVGLPGQIGAMKTKPKAHGVHHSADYHFRLGVFASDKAHVFAAPFLRDRIHGTSRLLTKQCGDAFEPRLNRS